METNSGDVSRNRGSWSPTETSPLPTLLVVVVLTTNDWGASDVSRAGRDRARSRFKSSRVVRSPPALSTAVLPPCSDPPDKSTGVSLRSTTACLPTFRPDLSASAVVDWFFSDFKGTSLWATFGSLDRRALRSGLAGCWAMSLLLLTAGGVTFSCTQPTPVYSILLS